MKKLFVFIGDSGSGKTTLIAELTKKHPDKFRKVVTCTSRKVRVGEVEGVDYNFLPRDYFDNNSNLVLVKKTNGGDLYGTRKTDLFSNTHHLLLTSKLTGVPKLVALGFTNIVVVRIKISKTLKIKRMRQRGDSERVISERLELDAKLTEIDLGNVPIIKVSANQPLNKKVECILKAC